MAIIAALPREPKRRSHAVLFSGWDAQARCNFRPLLYDRLTAFDGLICHLPSDAKVWRHRAD